MVRKVLISVDDSPECEHALKWAVSDFYKPGDEVHVLHVIPRLQLAAVYGAPPVDFLPQQDPVAYEQLIKQAEHFISDRFLSKLQGISPEPVVHIVKSEVDTDSIGNVICKKVLELNAAAVIMASHNKSRLQEFFLGSVTNHVTNHCKRPVLVVH
ncbi:hypothetical protein WJX72_011691 [[Myrmecia] bisecta]|uniref:UspA domain-containing protein n=1 Tax=[Myrmecia] bisecta TaxID=41462 RepID=A0AAW1Q162_9CHLO